MNDLATSAGRSDGDLHTALLPVAGPPPPCTAPAVAIAARFRTAKRRWATLISVFLAACVVSGPVSAWSTFEPYLGALGVFGSTPNHTTPELDYVYVLGNSAASFLSLPLGLLYDSMGPAVTGLVGACGAGIGLAGMAFGVTARSRNWLLLWGYPLSTTGGQLAAFAILGWQWLLPAHSTIVTALMGTSVAASDTLAAVGVLLLDHGGVSLNGLFLGLAVISFAGGLIIWSVAPGKVQTQLHFRLATGNATAEMKRGQLLAPLATCWKVAKRFPVAVMIMQLELCTYYFAVMYSSRLMENYFNSLFGSAEADALLDLFPLAQGLGGTLGLLLGGFVCNRIGMFRFNALLTAIQIGVAILSVLPHYWAQVAWMFGWSYLVYTPIVIYVRFAACYAPFEAFATFQGVLATVMVAPQMIFSEYLQDFMQRNFPERHYVYAFTVLNVAMVFFSVALGVVWCVSPPPASGSVQMHMGRVVLRDHDTMTQQTKVAR